MAAIDQYLSQANDNRRQYQQTGNDINSQLQNRLGYYGNNEENYRGQADTAFNDLAQTPGYTSGETSSIMGNPNAGFGYYNPDQLSNTAAEGNKNFAGSTADYRGDLTGAAARYGSGIQGAADKTGADLTRAAGAYGGSVRDAAGQARGDLANPANTEEGQLGGVYGYLKGANDSAVGGYGHDLNGAVDRGKLGLSSDFANSYKMTPEEQQNIKNVAAQTTAGQYGKMTDETKMRAAADGNTSPAAMAAIEQNLGRQGAIDAGNAASTAELAANSEAAARAKNSESMRLGAEQDISGRLSSNAGNLYNAKAGAAQNLAGMESQGIQGVAGNRLAGTSQSANLGYTAADTAGKAGYDATAAGDAQNYDASNAAGQKNYDAANTGGQAALNSGKYSADRTLSTAQGNQQTGQGLATAADTAGSNRAAGVAGQRIAGQTAYRGYLTGQQGTAQQGGETASGQQISNFGTQAGAQNNATSTGAQAAAQKDSKPGMFSQILGAASGIAGGLAKFADGGVIDSPTLGIVGERGPEMVIPVGKERSRFGRYGAPCGA